MSTTVWPPRPDALGSQTLSAQAAATAASTALPPRRRMSLAASVASGNAAETAALNTGRSAAASTRGPPPSMFDPPGVGTSHLGQIIEPTRAFGIGALEDPADLLWIVLVLVIAHLDALVGAQIENFNFAGDVGHDVLERLLNSAQPLIDAPDNGGPAARRRGGGRGGRGGPPRGEGGR